MWRWLLQQVHRPLSVSMGLLVVLSALQLASFQKKREVKDQAPSFTKESDPSDFLSMSKVRVVERIILLGQQASGLCHRVNATIAGYEQKQNSEGLKVLQDANVIKVIEIWKKNLEKKEPSGYYPTLEGLSPSLVEKVAPLIKDADAAEKISTELEDLYTLFLDCMIALNAAHDYFADVSEPSGFLVVSADGPTELCIEIVCSVSWIARLTILLGLFNDRVQIALVYAFTFQKCRGNAEAWFTDIVEYLERLSKPVVLLRDRLADGKGILCDILHSFRSHKSGALAKVFDVLETSRIPELDIMRDSTVLQYPLASRDVEDLMICCSQSSDLSVAFCYCALIALDTLLDKDESFAMVQTMIKSRVVLPLMDEHSFDFISEVYGAVADSADISWKAFHDYIGKDKRNQRKEAIKACISTLCQHAIPNHLRYRIFLKESIDRANWLLQDCGGVAAPQLPCLLALLGLTKAEIGWSFHHRDFKPQPRIEKLFKDHKFSASKAFDPEHMSWLYSSLITLKSNIQRLKSFITPYHVQLAHRHSEQFTSLRSRFPDEKIHVHMRLGSSLSAYVKQDNIDLMGLKLDSLRAMFLFSSTHKMQDLSADESIKKQIVIAASGLYRSMELAELTSRLYEIGNLSEFSHPPERFSQIVQEAVKVSGGIKTQEYNSSIGPLLTVPASWPVYSHEYLGPSHQAQVSTEAEDVFQHFVQLSCDSIMSCIKRVYDFRMQIGAHVTDVKAAYDLGSARFVLPKPSKQELIQLQSCIQSMSKSIDRLPPFVCGRKQVCASAYLANSLFKETIRFVSDIFCPNGYDQRPNPPATCVYCMSAVISVVGDLRASMRLEVWTVLRNAVCFNMFSSNFGALGKPPPSPFPPSPSELDIVLSYGNFFIKTLTEKGSQVYWQPLSKCFNSKDGKHYFQDYTSSFALENLCSLIGPVGVRNISQMILQASVDVVAQLEAKLKENAKPMDELDKFCSNQSSFQIASSALRSINAGEMGVLISTFGALLTLRSQLLLALNRVLSQRLNLIPTLVLDALCCSRASELFSPMSTHEISAFASDCGVSTSAVDPILVSKFENKFSDPSLRTTLTMFFAAMFAHPSLKIEKKFDSDRDCFVSNISCMPHAFLSLLGIRAFASSRSNSVEASKFAAHTQAIFAADVCHVIKAASLLLSGATERAIPFERIILLEQFVTEAAEIWSVPNSRLFALPYSLSRTCRLSLTVSAPVMYCCQCFLAFLTRDQGQSDDANFEVEDAN